MRVPTNEVVLQSQVCHLAEAFCFRDYRESCNHVACAPILWQRSCFELAKGQGEGVPSSFLLPDPERRPGASPIASWLWPGGSDRTLSLLLYGIHDDVGSPLLFWSN